MTHPKGGPPPFFLACCPRTRADALLARAAEAFQAGHYADALIAAESLCRRYPAQHIPALLRSRIVDMCRPELAARACYLAWTTAPELPMLQDAMLGSWLRGGAADSVRALGPAFLPARCRDGSHAALAALLRQAGLGALGACWKNGAAIEGVLLPAAGTPAQARLLLSDEHTQYQFQIPADGRRFRLPCPQPDGVWSLSFDTAAGESGPLQGAPLVFGSPFGPPFGSPFGPPPGPQAGRAGLSAARASERAEAGARIEARSAAPAPRMVDIVIPVYSDAARTRACIDSVLASLAQNATPAAVLVVDDASPEPALSAWLDGQAAAGRITLLRNRHNLGFIETCNRAMRRHPGRDIMLLNADTLVHGDWLDRLRAALYSAPDLASVTPWSNNGEISSFPAIANAARGPDAQQLARIDRTAAALRAGGGTGDIELPTCCGFAMLVRRSVLDEIGLLDGVHLVRGYGEEVDWCLRARAAGYRHLLASGVFIAHAGTVSFRFEKTLRVRQNRAVLSARHPRYHDEYDRFLADDPLQAARAALRAALAAQRCPWLAAAMHALHGADEPARPVPAPLPASCLRIGVWQHRAHHRGNGRLLELARLIASRPQLSLRLLVIGYASEALWRTGVVDALPSGAGSNHALLGDAALLGMAGCPLVLASPELTTPVGVARVDLDQDFTPQTWLDRWLAHYAAPAAPRGADQPQSTETAAA